MASESERVARRAYEAWNSLDLDRILAAHPPDFRFRLNANLPGVPQEVRGHEGIRELFREWYLEPWEDGLEMRVDHLYDLGDGRVLALMTFLGTGRDSGIRVEQRYAHLATLRDGLIAEIEGFTSWETARRAAGIDQ